MTKVGYTGTQHGMSPEQEATLERLLRLHYDLVRGFEITEAHHGDCEGGDEEFHHVFSRIDDQWLDKVVIHPPDIAKKRAMMICRTENLREQKYYTARNKDIVDETDVLFAAPHDVIHDSCRHGTCSTVRYARKHRDKTGKSIVIIGRDGSYSLNKHKETT